MHYNKDELEKQSIKVISENDLWTFQQVIGFLPCASSTFYSYELEKSENIKEALTKSRTKEFAKAFKRMKENESATAQIATLKILGDQDTRDALNGRVEEKEIKEVKVVIERKPIRSRDDIDND